jgi:hypothetical protein
MMQRERRRRLLERGHFNLFIDEIWICGQTLLAKERLVVLEGGAAEVRWRHSRWPWPVQWLI